MRLRKKVHGTAERPRLNVFVSSKHMYAQLINDDEGRTLFAVSTLAEAMKAGSNNVEKAKSLGAKVAEFAKANNISAAVFDRGGFTYIGKVKAVAEGAREGGLVI